MTKDLRPTCSGCKRKDEVIPNEHKEKPRHWICMRCNLLIRKPRL